MSHITVHKVFGSVDSKGATRYYRADGVLNEKAWPPDELHRGIAYIRVDAHGDDITSAYVEVVGTDHQECERMWEKVVKNLPLTKWWDEETE